MLYADRVYNPKFNKEPIIKPLLTSQQPVRSPNKLTFTKFGMNLGPSHPVISRDKYVKHSNYVQSPMLLADASKRSLADSFLVNQNQMTKIYQNAINVRRKQSQTFEQANKKFAASKSDRQRNINAKSNLTFGSMGITNNLQSPDYFRSYGKPSNTKELQNMYKVIDIYRNKKHIQNKPSKQRNTTCDKKQKSPFLFGSLRNLKPQTTPTTLAQQQSQRMRQSFSSYEYLSNRPQTSFVNQYQTASEMLRRSHSKQLATRGNTASSLSIAVPDQPERQTRPSSVQSSIHIGMSKQRPEFFKSNNQLAVEQLMIGKNSATKKPVAEFSFTRYKQRAKTNYDVVPATSKYGRPIVNKQHDFRMQITVDNGEPGLPVNPTTVYKRIADNRRFSVQPLAPCQDVYRENLCQSFISAKNSRILQKSVQNGIRSSQSVFNQGAKRRHGGGLFQQRVPHKPAHIIDSF